MALNLKAVYGVYKQRKEVERAIDALTDDGFLNQNISVLMPEDDWSHSIESKAPEEATAGASAGAIVGGTLGFLAGIGLLSISGVGSLMAAGPLVASLAGIGAGGAVGGLAGGLIGLGMPEFEAKRYEGYLKDGGLLLSVHSLSSEKAIAASKCLMATGANDVITTNEKLSDENPYVNQTRRMEIEGGPISPTSII